MVQIHDGGYTVGNSTSSPGYALFNASQGGLIYVQIQYRLGPFGFLPSAEIREDGVANAGLLHQRAALGWVSRNIRSFGGDPSKVTIIGGSAGGGSVMNQMILYGRVSNPPFRAAVAEYPLWQPYRNNSVLEDQYRQLLGFTKCTSLACLRSVDAATLATAAQAAYLAAYTANPSLYGYGGFYYGPSVDGETVRDLPSNEFKQGHFTKVPLLTDRDGYEGYVFSKKSETTVVEATVDLEALFPYAKRSYFDRLYELFPAGEFNSTLFQRQSIFGDFFIDCPTYYMATATSDDGLPTYELTFDDGAQTHGATGEFVFGLNSQSNNATLSMIMKDWFISFATALDPNALSYSGVAKPFWPDYNNGTYGSSDGNFQVMDVNYTMAGVIQDMDANARCDFFHGQSYSVRN